MEKQVEVFAVNSEQSIHKAIDVSVKAAVLVDGTHHDGDLHGMACSFRGREDDLSEATLGCQSNGRLGESRFTEIPFDVLLAKSC
jgi:hypothetical protein